MYVIGKRRGPVLLCQRIACLELALERRLGPLSRMSALRFSDLNEHVISSIKWHWFGFLRPSSRFGDPSVKESGEFA